MGRIADLTRAIMPVTWDALLQDSRIGDSVLDAQVTAAEIEIFTIALDDTEEDALQDIVAQYAANHAALRVIDTGIDFWMIQSQTETTTGTSEVVAYTDRIAALKELKTNIIERLARLTPLAEPLIPVIQDRRSAPLLSSIDDPLLTPNPQDLGPIYGEPEG